MEEHLSHEDPYKDESQDGLETSDHKENLERKKIVSLSSKKFAHDIIKALTVYIDIAERVAEEYKKIALVIAQIDNFYTQEKDTFAYYKRLLTNGKLTRQKLSYHASDIQDSLEVFEEKIAELIRVSRMLVQFFPDRNDRDDYDDRIDAANKLFNHIYQDIEDIAFEQQNLAKTL